ncbi:hypothetical protein D9M72_497840 [compost metagenome]
MTNDKKRFITNSAVDQSVQNVQHVIVARDHLGRGGSAHPRQVRVQAAKSGHVAQYWFKSASDFAVIHAGPVQSENRRAAAILGVMHRHSTDRTFHPDSVERVAAFQHRQSAPADGRLRRCVAGSR